VLFWRTCESWGCSDLDFLKSLLGRATADELLLGSSEAVVVNMERSTQCMGAISKRTTDHVNLTTPEL
jgi:hypothetical protein